MRKRRFPLSGSETAAYQAKSARKVLASKFLVFDECLLGLSWGDFGALLGPLGASWDSLGALLGLPWCLLGISCGSLGAPVGPPGTQGEGVGVVAREMVVTWC